MPRDRIELPTRGFSVRTKSYHLRLLPTAEARTEAAVVGDRNGGDEQRLRWVERALECALAAVRAGDVEVALLGLERE